MHNKTPTPNPKPKQTPITSVRDLKQAYPNQFDAIGSFRGKAMLHVKDNAKPTIDAPCKCSVHLKDKNKAELDNMEQQGVIRKIEYHTDCIYPDPSKVEAITSMPSPKDKEDVQRSLGLFTYLAAYIPNFSEKSAPLRELLHKEEARNVPLDVRVESICSEAEDSHQIELIFFGQHKRTELQRETANDPVLISLWQIVTQGWPETIQELPTSLRQFWSYRDEIGVSHGVLFKGSQVIIPKTLRNDILRHLGHMGIESTRRLALETVFWPNINKDIDQLIKQCETCQKHQARQQKEPLHPHDVPPAPWTRLGTDLFMLNRQKYLLVTDYYHQRVQLDFN
nr:uncharacterized protein K02A2.6-like [Lytechinus pictus]